MVEVNQQLPEPVPESGLSIAEAARRTGGSAHTLRYYERAGLVVTPVDRTHGGRRRYRAFGLEWINICTRLRATGMPIRGIRRYAELQENLKLIAHKVDVYRGRLAAGDADQLWAPHRTPDGH
ncbi:MerR family transcriptional regulator [Streptomyces sp. NPDC002215]|uniref:MerR family transcriptional regulator n=1 Tax=Streptomyces sp. NPDC002215 TaxID=3154412 RepID=UPI003318AD13